MSKEDSHSKRLVISWFSAGVSSAVATKLASSTYPDMKVMYIHIDDQHEDTIRFVKDCEKWIGIKIEILQSNLKSVNNACLQAAFINSPYGASCTRLLKKRVRKEWEYQNAGPYTYIWGYDSNEYKRAQRLQESLSEDRHLFPLIANNISKVKAHGILQKAGLKRPVMYELGYPNNNCIGCVKGGMGYWNKIRKDFPDVFEIRCQLEEKIGGRVFREFNLRDLEEGRGRDLIPIVSECGILCETIEI